MSASVRPVLLPGEHALRHLQDTLREALLPWCREWLIDADQPLPVDAWRCQAADCLTGEHDEWSGSSGRVWIASTAAVSARLVSSLLGDAPGAGGDAWTETALKAALADRDRRVSDALVGTITSRTKRSPDLALTAFGSGAVTLDVPSIGLRAIVDAGALRLVPPPLRPSARRPAIVALDQAARDATVRLTIELGGVELDVARLLDLQPGDVLRLPTSVTDRVPVRLGEHDVAAGALCHVGGHKAVQLHSFRLQPRSKS